jgi:hypothetical protein
MLAAAFSKTAVRRCLSSCYRSSLLFFADDCIMSERQSS